MCRARRFILIVVLFASALTSACARTRPYQREDLARPEMAPDPDPEQASLHQHLLGTREGAVGGFGGGGGGCGCN
ncbi:MAG TPA: DUF4266 domain-containing protein [Kofleriaceae bacterium]